MVAKYIHLFLFGCRRTNKMSEILCPECESLVKLGGKPHRGQKIRCPRCQSNLVVIGVKPIELDVVTPDNQSTKSKKSSNLVEVACPECDHFVKLSSRSRKGEQVVCDACLTPLEVVDTDPLELDVSTAPDHWRQR